MSTRESNSGARTARRRRIATLLVIASLPAACGPSFRSTANLNSTGATIICFGDSITRGYGSSAGNDYPSRLSAILDRPVLNAGKDGDTTAEALRRIQRDVLDRDPWIVIVEFGGNDLLQRVPVETTRQNLDAIVEQCIAAGAMVVLVHCKLGILLSDPYRESHQSVARTHGAVLMTNTLRGILGNPGMMYDPVHPNDEGYALIAERVAETVRPLIKAAEAARENS